MKFTVLLDANKSVHVIWSLETTLFLLELKYYEIESIKDFYSTTGSIDNGFY